MSFSPETAIPALLLVLLAAACITDLHSRIIPNTIPVLVVLLFVVALVLWPAFRVDSLWHVAAFGVAFAIGFVLFAMGVMGGGDVKLFAALALFHNLSTLGLLALTTSIAGAGVALIFAGIDFVKARSAGKGDGLSADLRTAMKARIPYGVGIFFGQLWTMAIT